MSQKILSVKTKLKRIARNSILITNYLLKNYKKVIWLIGDGRSGTTWVSSLINYNRNFREMFEPFHPRLKKTFSLLPHQYIRPDTSNKELLNIASDIFSGKYFNPRVDTGNISLFYSGILIKDIFANLFSYWALQHFPNIKLIFLIRHPFSVALSKLKRKNWFWMTNPMDFLNQDELYEDYLQPFEDLIQRTSSSGDYIQKQVLIWAIINYIPLIQFDSDVIHVVFYENIVIQPNTEILKIQKFINPEAKNLHINLPDELIQKPSRVANKNDDLIGTLKINLWKKELTSNQISACYRILEHFGLKDLYSEDSYPNKKTILRLNSIKSVDLNS